MASSINRPSGPSLDSKDAANLATTTQNPSQKNGQEEQPETPKYSPGQLTPWWSSPNPPAKLSPEAEKALMMLADIAGNKDLAARRWEVEQSWEARLFDRGYQYLLPRRGGGWILPPFSTSYNRSSNSRGGMKYYGYETNVYTTCGEIITAALTRDIPHVRFEPYNPMDDADITAAEAATRYAKVFQRQNDLLDFQHQLAYYLRNDGRALIVSDHVIDGQRFGYDPATPEPAAVPETEGQQDQALSFLVRHGETADNASGVLRGRRPTLLDKKGEVDAADASSFLEDKGIQKIIASPVPRAYEMAQILGQRLNVPVEVDERLASLDVGELAGEKSSGVGDVIRESFENKEEPIGQTGESPADFDKRVQEVAFEIIQSGEKIAAVTHDSVISSMARALMGGGEPKSDVVPPGGVAGIFPIEAEQYAVRSMYPQVENSGELIGDRGDPRGEELVKCFGKLEHKVPINTRCLADCPYLQVAEEWDIAWVKAMVAQIDPDKVNKVKPGGATAGENELDRIARINVALALEASYVTGDSMVRDCTIQRLWFRPSFFFEIHTEKVRQELLEAFPDGCMMLAAGNEFIMARAESMDDHCTLVQAFPGSGQNRIAMLSKVLSIQKRLNNWVDLLNDYFIRTIPQRYVDSEAIDVEALNEQPAVPGAYIPVQHDAMGSSGGLAGTIWVEPTPTHQPSMPEFIKMFANELPQLLSGALPSIFGAASNTDTVRGIEIQRDQALGRLGTPWHAIQMATANYFRQSVRLAAKCRKSPISSRTGDGEIIRIELAELNGNVLAYPESNANFPESWNQKQARYQELLSDASNPLVAGILASPANLKLARDMVGIPDFEIPVAYSYEKQLGEFDVLLSTSPVPNPAKQQMQQQVEMAVRQAQQEGNQDPQEQQTLMEAAEKADAMPDMVSSVEVDPDTDDHATEMQACLDWINKPQGRKFRYGNEQQKAAFQNVRLHFLEHKHYADALRGQQSTMKPPSTSIGFRDLPPDAAAAVLQKEGLPGSPESVQEARIAQQATKRLSKDPRKIQ